MQISPAAAVVYRRLAVNKRNAPSPPPQLSLAMHTAMHTALTGDSCKFNASMIRPAKTVLFICAYHQMQAYVHTGKNDFVKFCDFLRSFCQ